MKRLISIAALVAAAAVPLCALEFGGTLSNSTQFFTADWKAFGLSQQDALAAWVKVPLNESGSMYVTAEGSVTPTFYSADLSDGGTWTFPVDVDLCKFYSITRLDADSSVQVAAGRFNVSDTTGIILSQAADGLSVTLDGGRYNLSAYGGYTGLLNGHSVTMINGALDDSSNKVYYCASPFLVAGASVYLPYVAANQSVGVEFYTMIGMDGPNGDNSGTSRFYATLSANGPLAQNIFYTASTTMGFTGGTVANLTKAGVSLYPGVLNSALSLNVLYASGENGFLKPFTGFTSQSATYSAASPEYAGLLKAGVVGSVRPLDALYASLGLDVVFDCAESFGYAGVQWGASARYQLFTDVQLGLNATQFIGTDGEGNKAAVTLNAVIAF